MDVKIDVVIPAAGSGQRFGTCQPKQVSFYKFIFCGFVFIVKLFCSKPPWSLKVTN